jgi:hypothetical protein
VSRHRLPIEWVGIGFALTGSATDGTGAADITASVGATPFCALSVDFARRVGAPGQVAGASQ